MEGRSEHRESPQELVMGFVASSVPRTLHQRGVGLFYSIASSLYMP